MALLYAASAVGVAFAGDMLSSFSGGRLSLSLRSFKFGREGPRSPKNRVFRYLFFHVSSGLLLLAGIIIRYHGEGETAFSLVPLTQELEAGDTGALMILLAIGIKAAFPGLHVWLKDGYAEATPHGSGLALRFYHKMRCLYARPLVSGSRGFDCNRGGHGDVSHFLCRNRE